jgi:ATP-dependent RNA helicase RhlE
VKQLAQSGLRSEAIHGNKSQSVRQRALANFKSRRTRILVATDIAARGIDVEGISHVINYDLPHEPESYVHRIGRTGRAGASGIAVSLCGPEERGLLTAIERVIRRKLVVVPSLSAAKQPEGSTRHSPPTTSKPAPVFRAAGADEFVSERSLEAAGVATGTFQKNRVAATTHGQNAQGTGARKKWRSSRRRRRTFGPQTKRSDLSPNKETHSPNANVKMTSVARPKISVPSGPTKRRHTR